MPNPTTNLGMSLPTTEYDDQKVAKINAAFQILDALFGAGAGSSAFPSWTPTLTNLTIGNGTVTAKYWRIGKLVVYRLHIVLGSTSSVSNNAAGVSFSLPVTRVAYPGTATLVPMGQVRFYDLNLTTGNEGQVINSSTTTGGLAVFDASATYLKSAVMKDTVPFTWATGDEVHVQGWYEAA